MESLLLQEMKLNEVRAIESALFSGDILRLREQQMLQCDAVIRWRNQMKETVEELFYPYPPCEAHCHYGYRDFLNRVTQLTEKFSKNYRDDISNFLQEIGFDLDQLYWDKLVLRVVPPKGHYQDMAWHNQVSVHRDTWGVNLHSQINYWAPLFEVEANRTIQFFPQYWELGIDNTTDSWSYANYVQARADTPKGKSVSYPVMPQALCEPNHAGVPVVISERDWLLFSAAHLHASVPNTSSLTRFNIEFRIIDRHNVLIDRGAPNVDNSATKRMPGIFRHILSDGPLSLA